MERECSIEQSGYPTYRFRVSSPDFALNSDLRYESDDATDADDEDDNLMEASASDVDEGC